MILRILGISNKSRFGSFDRIVHFNNRKTNLSRYAKRWLHITSFASNDYIFDESATFLDDNKLLDTEYIKKLRKRPSFGYNVLVIQPKVKWGPKKRYNTTPELQLAESVTLAETIPDWTVVDKVIVSSRNTDLKFIFGSGNLNSISEQVHLNPSISAVFLSVNRLTVLQHMTLEKEFKVPVFDRYTVVLEIFRSHAHTKEAKLQVALAEIPYMRQQFEEVYERNHLGSKPSKGDRSSLEGESFLEIQRRIFQKRELKLKSALEELKNQRKLLRRNRKIREFPTVAIVGYTNSGKTSLIKALTSDKNLVPKDQLFATLDVTCHAGLLPSLQKVLYIDTVGFISDIPTTLIGSFAATLEDVALADLIVHIRDISHPDKVAQKDNVLKTLDDLQLPVKLLDTMIEVGNKVDLVESLPEEEKNLLCISATRFDGLDILRQKIEKQLIENTGRLVRLFRVSSGGNEMRWLYKEASITSVKADSSDPNYLLMEVIISEVSLSKFNHHFGDCVV